MPLRSSEQSSNDMYVLTIDTETTIHHHDTIMAVHTPMRLKTSAARSCKHGNRRLRADSSAWTREAPAQRVPVCIEWPLMCGARWLLHSGRSRS